MKELMQKVSCKATLSSLKVGEKVKIMYADVIPSTLRTYRCDLRDMGIDIVFTKIDKGVIAQCVARR